eukprot:2748640-Pyramimonas_sp.AAC.1
MAQESLRQASKGPQGSLQMDHDSRAWLNIQEAPRQLAIKYGCAGGDTRSVKNSAAGPRAQPGRCSRW